MNRQMRGNPNKIVFGEYVDADSLRFEGKQVELAAGGRVGLIEVIDGNLKLSGELDVRSVIVRNPRDGSGAADNGLYLAGASGEIEMIATRDVRRDQGKLGSDTHDLRIGCWFAHAAPPDETAEGAEPVHRDGLQISRAQRVTIEWFDYHQPYPGATNGGLWINPQKAGGSVDPTDPTLCSEILVLGGFIENPNAGIHLGYCTRCGCRDTVLVSQRGIRTHDYTVEPIGLAPADGNTLYPQLTNER